MLFRTRPAVPAVAKWTTCGAACRYFLMVCGFHNLMLKAFLGMHSVPSGATTLATLEEGRSEAAEMISAVQLVSDTTDNDSYRKALRIKSYKAFEWLRSEFTVFSLLTCTLVSQALEQVMWTFMSWQRRETWLSLEEAPLIQMASPSRSPAIRALRELSDMMRTSAVSTHYGESVSFPDPAAGWDSVFKIKSRI